MFAAIAVGFAAPLKAVHILWVNLLTDSLPCFALGVDPNSSSDVMNKKPRKNGESIFADGGYFKVGLYSIIIAVMTLIAFLYTPVRELMSAGMGCSLKNIIDCLSDKDILMQSQTLAFCTLAVSELFHAIGMRDTETSLFRFKHLDNKIMILAFAVGIAGQLAVTEIPFLRNIFGTVQMTLPMWGLVLILSVMPLAAHEIVVLAKKAKRSKKA